MLSTLKQAQCCAGSPCFDKVTGTGHRIILKGKSLKIPRNLSLTDYFSKSLTIGQINGNKIALIHEGASKYTFSALEEMSTKLSKSIKQHLEKHDWSRTNEDGDIVIPFCLGTTDKMILTIFSILKLGGTYLAIDLLTPEEVIVSIVNASKPIMIIIEQGLPIQTRFSCVSKLTNVITINTLMDYANGIPTDLNHVIPFETPNNLKSFERAAAIYYTNGLGGPRGVRIGHLAILNRIMWQWDAFPFEEDDVLCLLSPTMIHTSIPDIFAPLLQGKPLVILNRVNIPKPDFIINNIFENGITRITVSSEVLSSILNVIEEEQENTSSGAGPEKNNSEEQTETQSEQVVVKEQEQTNKSKLERLEKVSQWICCGDLLTTEICERFFRLFHETSKRNHGSFDSNNSSDNSPNNSAEKVRIGDTIKNPKETTSLKTQYSFLSMFRTSSNESKKNKNNLKTDSLIITSDGKTRKRCTLVHIYGSTETTADCSFEIFESLNDLRGKLDSKGRIPFGLPISNTQIFLMSTHSESKILGEGMFGEICVSGLSLAFGYTVDVSVNSLYKNPLVGSKDHEVMFRTNDLGRITQSQDGEYRLYYEGRCDSIIKLRGKRIDLNEIGRTIRATGLTNEVELFVYHQNFDDQVVVVSAVLKPGVQTNNVSKAIADKIPKDIKPEIFPVQQIPLLPDGRLDRNSLIQNYKLARRSCSNQDWMILGVSSDKMEHAKTLCVEVAASLGVSLRFVVTNFHDSYWNLGGNSHNAVILIERLNSKDYHLSLDDFINSTTLADVLEKMLNSEHKWDYLLMPCTTAHSLFSLQPLTDQHRDDVFKLICTCYPEKSDLALHVSAEYNDYEEFLDDIWDDLLKQNLSFVVVTKETNTIVGVNLNIDSNSNLIKIKKLDKPIRYIYELYDFCEKNVKGLLTFNKGRLIQPFMIATDDTISSAHNVLIVQLLLKETIEKGRELGFTELFVSSCLPLIRQLCKYIYKCEERYEYPIYQFVASDKTKPFYHAGVNYICTVFSRSL